MHQLGLGPINLVSHDVGMMVGYAYASAYPSEVKRLVLMEAALPGLGLEKLYDADKYPRMYHLPLFEAPNGLAEALITGREKMFVRHFMRQQAYDPVALEDNVLEEYARPAWRHRVRCAQASLTSALTRLMLSTTGRTLRPSFRCRC